MEKKKIFIGIAVFWLFILGGFIATKEYTLRTGTEVLLETVPVDPRDLFRGDYVILSYEIGRIDVTQFGLSSEDFEDIDEVYVKLEVDNNNVAKVVDILTYKPGGGLFLKGDVRRVRGDIVRVEYGIESYFVEENTGREIEKQISDVLVRVAIDKRGIAVIKSLEFDK